jgi:hypothetical protein
MPSFSEHAAFRLAVLFDASPPKHVHNTTIHTVPTATTIPTPTMPSTTPSPQTWTLRLKARKTTVLLHIDPLQTFSSLKEHLYTALADTSLTDPSTREPIPLPSSPEDIQLGRPHDRADPDAGFVLGEWEQQASEDGEDDLAEGKGKGKAKAKSGKGNAGAAVMDCPKGAGLKDRDVLAFRWRGDGTGWEDGDEDEDMEGTVKKDGMWGVKLASFEDGYGVENEADMGGLPGEFEG